MRQAHLWGALILASLAIPASAQDARSAQQGASAAAGYRHPPATTTFSGDTGLWYVPTAEVLPGKSGR
jgi:hypothetical protein